MLHAPRFAKGYIAQLHLAHNLVSLFTFAPHSIVFLYFFEYLCFVEACRKGSFHVFLFWILVKAYSFRFPFSYFRMMHLVAY